MPGFNDNQHTIWEQFFDRRTRQLWDRYPGLYRAVVVETNDPLNIYRVRFKCPELHNWDLKPEECPWAVNAHDLGGRRTGRWSHPIIDDWIWITFEKGHPYGPIWTGFCDPTRRKLYTYPSLFQKSPLSVNEKGDPADTPQDFDEDYLPKDGRPMSHGWQDRYGNLDMHRSVGFFPEEHEEAPPDADYDAIGKSEFKQKQNAPANNDPDAKYMVRFSKYGNMILQADQGYKWKEEFKGSFEEDEEFEIKRWKYIQKLINEDEPKDTDQRRIEFLTRYGHIREMRDVGWSKTREAEYGSSVDIGTKTDIDFRWIKDRTKGGMLIQMYDKGFDPIEDERVKRPLLDEVADIPEKEFQYWCMKDGRWIRIVTRHGFKFVLDDRGSDPKASDKFPLPRGNGILMKTRRPASSQGHHLKPVPEPTDAIQVGGKVWDGQKPPEMCPKEGTPAVPPGEPYQAGFWFEMNDNDVANWTSWGTPLGQAIFMNDKIQYIMLCSRFKDWAKPFMGLEENEFQTQSPTLRGAEEKTHHLKIDLDNEYIRFKTRAGQGDNPFKPDDDTCHKPSPIDVNPPGTSGSDINQGFEAHDGSKGDGPWVEVVDAKDRGIWFSSKNNLTVLRARTDKQNPKKISLSFDDDKDEVLLRNDETGGKLQIRCDGDIEIISTTGNITFKAKNEIRMEASKICANAGSSFVVDSNGIGTNGSVNGATINGRLPGAFPGSGAQNSSPVSCTIESPTNITHDTLKPSDRGKHYNDQFDTEVEREQIEHPLAYTDPCFEEEEESEGESDE